MIELVAIIISVLAIVISIITLIKLWWFENLLCRLCEKWGSKE